LELSALNALSAEIREFLIKTISETGGHLASNLGVVELTIALHYCFNSPTDKIIWDVGHQSYVHKILTGRRGGFDKLRKYGGLSGFTKTYESPHDITDSGHSSTSVSSAFGIACARDLNNEKYSVISVIGDGAMTGGLAFEALNCAGRSETDLIVILNDNQMSISKNVGALSNYLNNLRTAPGYIGAKKDVNKFLNKLPVIGRFTARVIEKIKNALKYLLVKRTIFEEFGFNYIGPIDGHNIEALIKVLKRIKTMKGPVLLHIYTKKGKGFALAEMSPESFHGVGPYDIERGEPLDIKLYNTYSDVFGKMLLQLAKENEKITAITAAMPSGTGLSEFAEKYPDRYFDAGIAEAHAVTFAAGLARGGFTPFVAIYSTFLQRAYDQILHDVCLPNLHIVFAIDRAGVPGDDGETHQGIYDLAYLSHIPNMTVMSPKNRAEFMLMLRFAATADGPVAVRYPKGVSSVILKEFKTPIALGSAEMIKQGGDIIIIALGEMVETALETALILEADGISVTLVNARFVRPLDMDLIESLGAYKHIFTIESAIKTGGLSQGIAAEIAKRNFTANFYAFTFPDTFLPQGAPQELMRAYGLHTHGIYRKIKELIKTLVIALMLCLSFAAGANVKASDLDKYATTDAGGAATDYEVYHLSNNTPLYDAYQGKKRFDYITPQTVKVIKREKDWLFIETWLGGKWINLNEIRDSVLLDVPNYHQIRLGYITGCEIVAFGMMVNYEVDVDMKTLVDKMPRSDDPFSGFRGNPLNNSGFTIFPSALAGLTEEYLGGAVDLTGYSMEDLKVQLNNDTPVFVIVSGLGYRIHALCLTGYNAEGFYFNNPANGRKNQFITYEAFDPVWAKPIYDKRLGKYYPARIALGYKRKI